MHAAYKEEEPEPCVSALFLKLFFFLSPRAVVCVFPVFFQRFQLQAAYTFHHPGALV